MVMQTGDIGAARSTRRAFMTRSAGTLAAVGGAGGTNSTLRTGRSPAALSFASSPAIWTNAFIGSDHSGESRTMTV